MLPAITSVYLQLSYLISISALELSRLGVFGTSALDLWPFGLPSFSYLYTAKWKDDKVFAPVMEMIINAIFDKYEGLSTYDMCMLCVLAYHVCFALPLYFSFYNLFGFNCKIINLYF